MSPGKIGLLPPQSCFLLILCVHSPSTDLWGATVEASGGTLVRPESLHPKLAAISWTYLDDGEYDALEQRRGRPFTGLGLDLQRLDLKKVDMGLRGN